MFDVFFLDRGIYPAFQLDVFGLAVDIGDGAGHVRERFQIAFEAGDRDGFVALQTKRSAAVAACELERDDAHANKIGAVDTLEAFGDNGFDAEKGCAFGGPVTRGTGTILLAAEDHQRDALILIGHGRVEYRLLGAVRAGGVAAFDAVQHLVLDADVGEGAAHHDLVVAPA